MTSLAFTAAIIITIVVAAKGGMLALVADHQVRQVAATSVAQTKVTGGTLHDRIVQCTRYSSGKSMIHSKSTMCQ